MAAGGQGAPLVAYIDALLLTHPTLTRAAQNIGGIANVTYLPSAAALQSDPATAPFAFDTGPGNMLLDDAMVRISEGALAYDAGGALAAQGQVDADWVARLLREPYLHQPPPKTTGRELFGTQFGARLFSQAQARGTRPADIMATLTAFTAASIARAYHDFLPRLPDEVIVSGGGARNLTLLAMLRARLPSSHIRTSESVGLGVEAKEAVAFAVLAYETWHQRPGNLPAATGASRAVVLGNVTWG